MLSVITYKDVAEAIEIANDSEYGLSGAVVGDEEEARRLVNLEQEMLLLTERQLTMRHLSEVINNRGWPEKGHYGIEDYLEIKAIFK